MLNNGMSSFAHEKVYHCSASQTGMTAAVHRKPLTPESSRGLQPADFVTSNRTRAKDQSVTEAPARCYADNNHCQVTAEHLFDFFAHFLLRSTISKLNGAAGDTFQLAHSEGPIPSSSPVRHA